MRVGGILLLLVLVSPLQAGEKIYTGQFRYLADSGLFEDCLSGDRWPVAMKAAYAELEGIYLEERSGGEPLWVKVEGEVQRKLDLEAGKRRLYFVVSRVLESGVRECDPLPKVPLEGTPWVLVELGGRHLASGKRRDPYLELRSGTAMGFGGCNHFKVRYVLDGGKIRFEQPGTTRLRCDTGYELETAYMKMLQRADGWRMRGKLLDIFDADGKRIARFATGNP